MQCEYNALEGYPILSDHQARTLEPQSAARDRGFVAHHVRSAQYPANQVSQQLEQHFGDKVYRTMVPRNVRLAEAPSYGAPAVVWDKSSKGAQAYVALTEEILRGYA